MCCFCLYGVVFCHAIMELQYFNLYYFVNMLNIINWLIFLFNDVPKYVVCYCEGCASFVSPPSHCDKLIMVCFGLQDLNNPYLAVKLSCQCKWNSIAFLENFYCENNIPYAASRKVLRLFKFIIIFLAKQNQSCTTDFCLSKMILRVFLFEKKLCQKSLMYNFLRQHLFHLLFSSSLICEVTYKFRLN